MDFFTDRIVELAKEFPHIGIRISIEGLEQTNNEIRGLENGYQRGYQTLKKSFMPCTIRLFKPDLSKYKEIRFI